MKKRFTSIAMAFAVAAALAACEPVASKPAPSGSVARSYEPQRAHPPVMPSQQGSPAKATRKPAATAAPVVLGKRCKVGQIGDSGKGASGEWYVCARPNGGGSPRWATP